MKLHLKRGVILCFILVMVVVTGCSGSNPPSQSAGEGMTESVEEVENPPQPVEEETLPTQTEEVIPPTETPEDDPTQAPLPTQTATDEAVPAEEATEQPAIVHEFIPESSKYFGNQVITECNTGYNFASAASYRIPKACDSWRNNLLERPISQDLTTFYPYLDILSAMAGFDDNWYFISFTLFDGSNPTDGSPFYYFVELDSNFDGRGDFLVVAENLTFNKTDWTVEGLSLWQDTNKDVGSFNAVLADPQNAGDGYDTLIFDQGISDDPDLIWARRKPGQTSMVEFAIKRTLFGSKSSFLWWVGALQGELNPSAFDLVDGQAEADFFEIDTTCAWPLGVSGKGYPKQCYVPEPTPVPTNMPSPKNVCVKPAKPNPDPCWIWMDKDCEWVCFN